MNRHLSYGVYDTVNELWLISDYYNKWCWSEKREFIVHGITEQCYRTVNSMFDRFHHLIDKDIFTSGGYILVEIRYYKNMTALDEGISCFENSIALNQIIKLR